MKKGIFWIKDDENLQIIKITAKCEISGEPILNTVRFSSKSGGNFNHKAEWEKLSKSETGGLPYNYYPRGRVEIKNGKITIYLNPDINRREILNLIIEEFGLESVQGKIRTVSDGSYHYKYLKD